LRVKRELIDLQHQVITELDVFVSEMRDLTTQSFYSRNRIDFIPQTKITTTTPSLLWKMAPDRINNKQPFDFPFFKLLNCVNH